MTIAEKIDRVMQLEQLANSIKKGSIESFENEQSRYIKEIEDIEKDFQ